MRRCLLLLFLGLAWNQTFDPVNGKEVNSEFIAKEKNIFNKHNITIGWLDDRTGLSILGYTRNLKQTTSGEYFIGAGTMILGFSATIGYQYYYIKSKLSISSFDSAKVKVEFGSAK